MRQILGFFSLVAVAVLTVGALGVVGLGPMNDGVNQQAASGAFLLDYRSLLAGTVLGVVLSNVFSWDWTHMPRRAIAWIAVNERKLIRCGYAATLLAVLLFY